MQQLIGLITALITPFDERGNVDLAGFRENIQYQLSNQVDGLVALGTTGEAPTLNEDEKCSLIKCAREETKGKVPLIVGTGSYATRATIENTKRAKDLGADYALVVNPYYNKPTQGGLYLHFKEIAEKVDIPLILYNHMGRCGVGLEISTIKRLAKIPGIVGIKEVTTNIDQLNTLIEAILPENPHFKIYAGDDSSTFTFLANGAHGLISVAGNLVPRQMKALIDACFDLDFVQARKHHLDLMPLFRAMNIESNPIPIKTAMKIAGMPSGECRMPLCQMQPKNKEILIKTLEEMSLSRHLMATYG